MIELAGHGRGRGWPGDDILGVHNSGVGIGLCQLGAIILSVCIVGGPPVDGEVRRPT